MSAGGKWLASESLLMAAGPLAKQRAAQQKSQEVGACSREPWAIALISCPLLLPGLWGVEV